jgi:diguanylate cyclase (GGDEF)-like protein
LIEYIYKYEAAIRLSVFVCAFGVFALWEWGTPKRELTQVKYKRWFNNFAMVVCSTMVVRLFVPTAVIGVAYFVDQAGWGFANYFEMSFWFSVVFSFILLDLAIYFQHAMFHVLPVMWRFHRVHHSDLDFDITTGLRFHPGEVLISLLIKFTTVVALGAPVLAVILFEVSLNFMAMFTHSNIRLNKTFERVLRWFIVTPDMHRVHHSILENETNSNFAFNISLWDRIFGTYIAKPKAGHQGMTIGLEQFRELAWQRFSRLIFMPFAIGIKGYAINYRDTKNADELALARDLALHNEEKAKLASALEKANQKLAKANKKLEQLSRVDELTQVANRRHFDETLRQEISKQSRHQSPLTLFICDIDYFKKYNDSNGHLAGDRCLNQVAQSIKSNFTRAGDFVARYGGEEFAVILPNVDKETALMLAERMRVNVENLKLAYESSATSQAITISVGVTSLMPEKNTAMTMLIARADKALYLAKEKGRNNVRYSE